MARRKYNPYDILLVQWDDAAGCSGWNKNEERLLEPHHVNTVGMYLRQNKGRLLLCMNHAWEEVNHGDYMSIPRGMIRNIEVLKRARKV